MKCGDLLLGRVIELVLAGAAEALLDAVVFPQSLHDVGQLDTQVAVVGGCQRKQLASVVLCTPRCVQLRF